MPHLHCRCNTACECANSCECGPSCQCPECGGKLTGTAVTSGGCGGQVTWRCADAGIIWWGMLMNCKGCHCTEAYIFLPLQVNRPALPRQTRDMMLSSSHSQPITRPQERERSQTQSFRLAATPVSRWKMASVTVVQSLVQFSTSRCSCLYISSALVSTSLAHGTMREVFGVHLA